MSMQLKPLTLAVMATMFAGTAMAADNTSVEISTQAWPTFDSQE